MRLPDPIANTTTEAYLAYKAGVLNIGDLKPSLYDPYLHYDAWLAYWAGLVDTYPIHDVGKNLYNKATATSTGYYHQNISNEMPVEPGLTYTFNVTEARNYAAAYLYDSNGTRTRTIGNATTTHTVSFRAASNEVKVVLEFYAELNVDVSTYDFTGVQFELGSTATPYEPYTGTPECLTDEEALVAYLSGVTNTYPEEYSDPIDARITGYLRYLVSARFGRPDYPVNNIEFYLSLMKPPIVTNDTPSSNIELDNTAWAELIDVKMYGDTFQQTYTGKNLYKTGGTTTNHQIAYTLNADGTYSIKGTADAQANDIAWMDIADFTDGATYAFSSTKPLLTGMRILLEVYNGSTWVRHALHDSGHDYLNPESQTIVGSINLSGGDRLRTVLRIDNGTTIDVTGYGFQLEKADAVTSFEPYVGGVPAPNPDYPQAVQTVTGRQTVKVQGKNLINLGRFEKGRVDNGVIGYTEGTDSISVSGDNVTFTTNYIFRGIVSEPIAVTPSSDIVFSGSSDDANTRLYVDMYTSSGTWISRVVDNIYPNEWPHTAKVADNCAYVRISFQRATPGPTTLSVLQLEKSDQATTYEPYQSQEHEVNLGSIELCKIGDYQDYIYKDGQQWYIHEEVRKKIFSGSENWTSYSSTGFTAFYYTDSDAVSGSASSNPVMSDSFISKYANEDGVIYLRPNPRQVVICTSVANSVANWKTWLEQHNVTAYYAITEPTDIEITNAALVAQLDALAAAKSCNDKTYITVEATDPNLPTLLKVEAGAE